MPLKLDQGVLSCHFNLKAIEETGLRASFMLLLSSPGTPRPLLYQKPMIQPMNYMGPLHLELCLLDSRAGPLSCSQAYPQKVRMVLKARASLWAHVAKHLRL